MIQMENFEQPSTKPKAEHPPTCLGPTHYVVADARVLTGVSNVNSVPLGEWSMPHKGATKKMKSAQVSPQLSIGADAEASSALVLPDVNVETYPFDVVQHLLDKVAYFSMFAIPTPQAAATALLTPDPDDWFGLNGGYGLMLHSSLHGFESVVQSASSFHVTQTVGSTGGIMQCRWFMSLDDCEWAPGHYPPPILFDPWRPQSFVMLDCKIRLGTHARDGFRGYGQGRTFPVTVNGQPQVLAGAVGNLTEGFGKFHGLAGTYVFNGTITPSLGFLGNLTCRVEDPDNQIHTERELPALAPIPDPEPGVSVIVMRGEKRDRTVRTEYGPPPASDLVSLVTPAQMRSAQFRFTQQGPQGLRSTIRREQIVADLRAAVTLDILASPGTATAPNFFTTQNVYTFYSSNGKSIGSITAEVVLGRSFGLQLPAAPEQPGMRYGGVGPIVDGTGQFSGAQGLLSVNSAIGVMPHALSMLNMLRLIDPDNRFRSGRHTGPSDAKPSPSHASPAPDPFLELIRRKDAYTDTYIYWRRRFKHCSDTLSTVIADAFNKHAHIGEFPGLHIDAEKLASIFRQDVSIFDRETFNRYGGAAKGIFRTYNMNTEEEVDVSTLYSFWGDTLQVDDRHVKKISGSNSRYFEPEDLPPLIDNKVDLIVNSYREDVGVTSWVSIYQQGRQERTSFAYTLPHKNEVLWIVKDISQDGKDIENDIFMVSHEWKGDSADKQYYFLVGIFFQIDLDACTVQVFGDIFWKAKYEEE